MKRLSHAAICGAMVTAMAHGSTFVTETVTEFHASADFNADGLVDVLVVDKATGLARVGLGTIGGAHDWMPAVFTGVDAPSAVAVGHMVASSRSAFAVTSPQANRVQILEAGDGGISTPGAYMPPGVGPNGVAALEIGGFGVNPDYDDLAIATRGNGGAHPNQSHLVRTGGAYAFFQLTNATIDDPARRMFSLNPVRMVRDAAAKPYLANLYETETVNRLQIHRVDSGVIDPVEPMTQLSPPLNYTRFVSGFFGTTDNVEASPHFILYNPNATQTIAHQLKASVDEGDYFFNLDPTQIINYPNSVKSITVIPRPDPHPDRLLVLFSTGPNRAILYDYNGFSFPQQVAVIPVPVVGEDFTGVAAMPGGEFVLFTGDSMDRTTGSHRYSSAGVLIPGTSSGATPLNRFATRANVLLYSTDPDTASDPRLVGSLNAGDWTSGVDFDPADLTVTRENYLGDLIGLASPGTVSLGAPPVDAAAARANQPEFDNVLLEFNNTISYFALGGASGPVVPDPTIAPTPGTYDAAVAISFAPISGMPPAAIRYRIREGFFGPEPEWSTYDPQSQIVLYQNSTVEYFAQTASDRSPIRSASYNFNIPNHDSNEDGMPDWVRAALGLDPTGSADSDGDGVSDLMELLFGTDPNDPASSLEGTDDGLVRFDLLGSRVALDVTARPVNGRSEPPSLTWPLVQTSIRVMSHDGQFNRSSGIESPGIPPMPLISGTARLGGIEHSAEFPYVGVMTSPNYQVTSRVISEIVISNEGAGYPDGTVAVSLGGANGASGTGALLEANAENGSITSVDIIQSGADFTGNPIINLVFPNSAETAVGQAFTAFGSFGRELLAYPKLPDPTVPNIPMFFPGGDPVVAAQNWLQSVRDAYGISIQDLVGAELEAESITFTATGAHGLEPGDWVQVVGMSGSVNGQSTPLNAVYQVALTPTSSKFVVAVGGDESGTGGHFSVIRSYGEEAVGELVLTWQTTAAALAFERVLGDMLGRDEVTLFPLRSGDQERMPFDPADYDLLALPLGFSDPAYRVDAVHEFIHDALLADPPSADVAPFLDACLAMYQISSRRDSVSEEPFDFEASENDPDYVPPPPFINVVDAIRSLLLEGSPPDAYATHPLITAIDPQELADSVAHIRGLRPASRPQVVLHLEVPPGGVFPPCITLNEVGGWNQWALVDLDGEPYRITARFQPVAGMRFLVQGFSDVTSSTCFAPNIVQVRDIVILENPFIQGADGDGNMLTDSWDRIFGSDPWEWITIGGNSYQRIQFFLEGSDPLTGLGMAGLDPLDLRPPNPQIERYMDDGSQIIRLWFQYPSRYAPYMRFPLFFSNDLTEFNSIFADAYDLGAGQFENEIDETGNLRRFYRYGIGLRPPNP